MDIEHLLQKFRGLIQKDLCYYYCISSDATLGNTSLSVILNTQFKICWSLMDSQDRWLSEMWQAPKSRTDIWLRLPGWKERERGEVHEARKPYEAISLADSDTQRERGSKSPSTKIGTNKTKLGWSKCGFVIQFSRIALLGSEEIRLMYAMGK